MTPRKRLWSFLRFGLTVVLLIAIFRRIPLADVVHSFRSMALLPLLLSFVGVFLMRYLSARRTKLLTDVQGIKLSTGEIFEVNCVSTLYGLALPGSISGGAVRWYKFAAHQTRPAGALTSIAFDRLIDVTSLIALGCFFWIIDIPRTSESSVGIGLVIAFLVLMAFLALAVHESGSRAVISPFRRIRWSFLPGKMRDVFGQVVTAIRVYQGQPARFFLPVTGWSLATQVASTLAFLWTAQALHLNVPLAPLGWIRAYISLLAILPISFAGLGVREGALVVLLSSYGVSGADAVALSFLQLLGTLAVAAAGGAYELRRSLWHPKS